MLRALAALALCACAHHERATARMAEVAKVLDTGQKHEVITATIHDGASEVITLKFESLAGGRGAPGTAYPPSAAVRQQDLGESNPAIEKAIGTLPPHGPLLEARIEHFGPKDTTLRDEAEEARKQAAVVTSTLAVDSEEESHPAWPTGALWALAGVLVAAAVVLVAWKRRE